MPRIKPHAKSEAFLGVQQASFAFNEANDCTVRALAIAAGVPYADAHATLQQLGRNNGRGVYFNSIMNEAFKRHGCRLTRVNMLDTIATYPGVHSKLKSLTTHHPDRFKAQWPAGTFIMFTSGHVLAIKDGVNHDWTRGRAKRAVSLWRVEKIET